MVRTHRGIALLLALIAALAAATAAQAQLFTPQKDVTAYVWTNSTSPDFVWPELSDTDFGMPALMAKPSFGVGFSGGGNRANVLALGWTRALHKVRCLQIGAVAARGVRARLVSSTPHRTRGRVAGNRASVAMRCSDWACI